MRVTDADPSKTESTILTGIHCVGPAALHAYPRYVCQHEYSPKTCTNYIPRLPSKLRWSWNVREKGDENVSNKGNISSTNSNARNGLLLHIEAVMALF